MNYTEWKQEYLECLIQLIKQHEYSKNHSNDAINELAIELLERGGFDEDFGHWEVTPPEQAVQESFLLWLTDYFEGENNG